MANIQFWLATDISLKNIIGFFFGTTANPYREILKKIKRKLPPNNIMGARNRFTISLEF